MRAKGNETTGKLAQRGVVFGEPLPVDPRDLTVLAVAVIVPLLRAAKLVPRQQHRRAVGKQQRGQEITLLPLPGRDDVRVLGWPFLAVVVRAVIVMPVVIVLAVVGVVLLVVRHQVIQRKAVVGGDKVDAGPRATPTQIVQIAGAQQPRGKVRGDVVPLPVLANGVAVFVVPLPPARRESAHLIAAGADIPGFTNQL